MATTMHHSWSVGTARRFVRRAALASMAALTVAATAPAEARSPLLAAEVAASGTAVAGGSLEEFYRARDGRPLWFAPGQEQAAAQLLDLLQTSELDGIAQDPNRLKQLDKVLRNAFAGDSAAVERAETMLSDAFVRYVRALREINPREAGWEINDRELQPRAPRPSAILAAAAAADSLSGYVGRMGWMHSSYAELRRALADAQSRGDAREAALLRANMIRTRMLPGDDVRRYVLVNTAAQRLYMVENGHVVDWMKVVVGKPDMPTPQMAALIRYTALNPYWYVPPDLAAERIAPGVVKEGPAYLTKRGYVLLSDWGENARRLDPSTVDWKAVADGRTEVLIRQDPGIGNSMGQMKFMFPNPQGVYLHDTPNKELMSEEARLYSGGCVRLEAAPRLAEWLYGRKLVGEGKAPEQKVDLDTPVPVYMAYLTAVPQGNRVVFFDDVYGQDARALASMTGGGGPPLAGR